VPNLPTLILRCGSLFLKNKEKYVITYVQAGTRGDGSVMFSKEQPNIFTKEGIAVTSRCNRSTDPHVWLDSSIGPLRLQSGRRLFGVI
jgi:hypothetical protein